MQVGELAQRTGASIRSLHYYEQMGVLQASRQENGYRDYASSAVEQVRRIRSLIALGFTLEEIHDLAPCITHQEAGAPLCSTALTRYQQKIEELDAQIHVLQEIRTGIVQRLQVARTFQHKENPV